MSIGKLFQSLGAILVNIIKILTVELSYTVN